MFLLVTVAPDLKLSEAFITKRYIIYDPRRQSCFELILINVYIKKSFLLINVSKFYGRWKLVCQF